MIRRAMCQSVRPLVRDSGLPEGGRRKEGESFGRCSAAEVQYLATHSGSKVTKCKQMESPSELGLAAVTAAVIILLWPSVIN